MNIITYKNQLISFFIVFIFSLLSIKYALIISGISAYYFILIILILHSNFKNDYENTLLFYLFLLILNELFIRVVNNIGISSDGNAWSFLFFFQNLIFSYISLLILTIIINKSESLQPKIIKLTTYFALLGLLYFMITKPI